MRVQIKGLMDQRKKLVDENRTLLDTAETEERDLDATEWEQYESRDEKIAALDDRIDQLTEIMERDKKRDETEERILKLLDDRRETDPPKPEATEADQFRQLAAGEIRGFDVSLAGMHVETRDQDGTYEVRDLASGTASAGGDTIPTSFVRSLYEHMIENSAIRRTNVTVIQTASGEALEFPKTTAHSSVSAVTAEAAAISESDPTFGKMTLNAYKYGVIIQVPFELLTDTGVALEDYLSRQMGRALGNGAGAHFVTGDGSSKPNGVVTASTLGVTGATTGVSGLFTADELIDLFYSVIDEYGRNGYWLMRRATEGEVRQLKDSNNQYLWQPGLQIGAPNTLLGRPLVKDPNVAAIATSAKSVLFGDFRPYYIREVQGVRVTRSDDFAFNQDLATFKATIRVDGDLIDTTGAIKHYIGAAT